MRALVIDDDVVYRLLISLTLTTLGYTVDEAHDGQFGWQMAQLSPYDLVVTDIVMPHQDGISIIRLLGDQYPSTRIIAVSGGGSLKSGFYLSAARVLGAHAVLAKPFVPSALSDAVTRICGDTAEAKGDPGSPAPAAAELIHH